MPKGEARDTAQQALRIHFYGKFGIEFDFTDDVATSGLSRQMQARDLVAMTSRKETITELSVVVFLRERRQESERGAAEVSFLRSSLKHDGVILSQAYRHPIKWMFRRLVTDNLTRTGFVAAFMIVIGLGIYRAF